MYAYIHHTAHVSVFVPQLVNCVHCKCKFVYEMQVTGCGSADSGFDAQSRGAASGHARTEAQAELEKRLTQPELCDPIPCPTCLKHQPYMRAESASRHYFLLELLGCLAIFFGVLALLGSVAITQLFPKEKTLPPLGFTIGTVLVVMGGISFATGRFLMWRHNPDDLSEDSRRTLADERTLSVPDFEKIQEQRSSERYRDRLATLRGRERTTTTELTLQQPFVLEWWVLPTVFDTGGEFTIRLSPSELCVVRVNKRTKSGEILEVESLSGTPLPLKVRVFAIRTHPDEQQLE